MDKKSSQRCTECTQFGICLESCMVVRSGKPSILSELTEDSQTGAWNCVNCWKCIEDCPLKVDIYGFMMERRREENIPALIKKSIDNITRNGCAMNLRGINEIREMYDLNPLRFIEESKVKMLLECESSTHRKQ